MITHIFNNLSQDWEKSSNINEVNRKGPLAFLLLEGIDIHTTLPRKWKVQIRFTT